MKFSVEKASCDELLDEIHDRHFLYDEVTFSSDSSQLFLFIYDSNKDLFDAVGTKILTITNVLHYKLDDSERTGSNLINTMSFKDRLLTMDCYIPSTFTVLIDKDCSVEITNNEDFCKNYPSIAQLSNIINAKLLTVKGKYDQASKLWREILEQSTFQPQALSLLCYCMLKLEDLDSTSELIDQRPEGEPDKSAYAQAAIAVNEYRSGNKKQGDKFFKKAMKLKKNKKLDEDIFRKYFDNAD